MRYLYLLCLLASSTLTAQTIDFITGIDGPSGMTTLGSTIFFSQYSGGKISFTDLNDPDNNVVDLLTGLGQPYGVAIHDGYLYYAENDFDRLSRVELGNLDAEPEEIVSQIVTPNAVHAHGDYLYFTHFPDEGEVYRLSFDNLEAAPDTILRGLDDPGGLLVIGNELYISEFGTGTVSKIRVNDFDSERTIVLDNLVGPNHMTYHEGILYVGLFSQGWIVTLDIASGQADVLLDNLLEPTGLAIVNNELYIGLFVDDKIVKLELPNSTAGPEEDLSLQLFPNPSTDWIQLQGWEGEAALFASSGQYLGSAQIRSQEVLSVSHLPQGQYWIVLPNGRSLPFVKQ